MSTNFIWGYLPRNVDGDIQWFLVVPWPERKHFIDVSFSTLCALSTVKVSHRAKSTRIIITVTSQAVTTYSSSHQMWVLGLTLKTSGRKDSLCSKLLNHLFIPLHGLLDLCSNLMLWELLSLCQFASAGTRVQKLRWHVSGEQKEGWSRLKHLCS